MSGQTKVKRMIKMTVSIIKQHKINIRGHDALLEMKKVDSWYIITEIMFDDKNTSRLIAYLSTPHYIEAVELYNELVRYEHF